MNVPGLSGLSESLNKRMTRFLVHRYLGHFLKEKLCLEQLTIDVVGGTGTLAEINLDPGAVNEALDTARLPLTLLDGYIGSVRVAIPWADLLTHSCTFEIFDLQLTLEPKSLPDLQAFGNPDQLMGSMLESMMGSLTSSMDMARSILSEDLNDQADCGRTLAEEGIEAFAHVIDAVLSRMRVEFHDTILRLEHFPQGGTRSLGLEVSVGTATVVDEVMSAAEADPEQPITTQPHLIHSVPDLNKILHLQNVKLYTDLFSAPEQFPGGPDLGQGSVLTSMYIRRHNAATTSTYQKEGEVSESTITSAIFQSCVSNFNGEASVIGGLGGPALPPSSPVTKILVTSLTKTNLPSSIFWCGGVSAGLEGRKEGAAYLASNPVQFAELDGERQKVRFRLRNGMELSEADAVNRKLEIEMFLGSLNMFLTPTQLFILTEIAGAFITKPSNKNTDLWGNFGSEKPMESQDFARVERQLQEGWPSNQAYPNSFSLPGGNWSAGEEKFYSTSSRPTKESHSTLTDDQFTSINMSSLAPGQEDPLAGELRPPRKSTASSRKGGSSLSEMSEVRVTLGRVWVSLSHEDPLGTAQSLRDATATVHAWANAFFPAARQVKFGLLSDLSELRETCDAAFARDHLRFLGCKTVVEVRLERDDEGERTAVKLGCGNCQLLEVLTPASVIAAPLVPSSDTPTTSSSESEMGGMEYVEMLCFDRVEGEWQEEANLRLSFTSPHLRPNRQGVMIELGKARSEVDLSLVDRLYCLLSPAPPVFHRKPTPQNPSQFELREDLFAPVHASRGESEEMETHLDIRAPHWTIDLRFPVPDLRDRNQPERPSWFIRRVRNERLRLKLTNAQLSIPNLGPAAARQGLLQLFTHSAIGSLLEPYLDSEGRRFSKETAFLFATGLKDVNKCSVKVSWDFADKGLAGEIVEEETGSGASSWGSYFQLPKSLHGPFSTKKVLHEDEELTLVGSRDDMRRWRDKCLGNVEVSIGLSLSQLRVLIPSKAFYETLYNRLLNDLALWEPSSPTFARPEDLRLLSVGSIHVPQPQFQLCRSILQQADDDSDNEDNTLEGSEDNTLEETRKKERKPSKIAFSLSANACRALLDAPILDRPEEHGEISLAGKATELFLVSGFEGDVNLAYMHLTIAQLWLWHLNMPGQELCGFESGVAETGFGRPMGGEAVGLLAGEPTPEPLAPSTVHDDNFAIGMRLQARPLDALKEILVTIGIRNTTLHHSRPIQDPNDWWLMELVELFTVLDDPVPGYEMPRTITQLHVHAWSSAIAYSTPPAPDGERLHARLWLEDLDLQSYIVQDARALRLHCLLEDARLYVAQAPSPPPTLAPAFHALLHSGFFHFQILLSEDMQLPQHAPPPQLKRPWVEVEVRNEELRVWVCADAVGVLARLVAALVAEATPPPPSENHTPLEETKPKPRTQLTQSDEEHLQKEVESAMECEVGGVGIPADEPSSGLGTTPSSLQSDDLMQRSALLDAAMEDNLEEVEEKSKSRSGSIIDEEYCIVDEIAGSGVRSRSGEPRIRLLGKAAAAGGVRLVENHFSPSTSRCDPLESLPAHYPAPLLRYLLKDLSLELNLYGGADFQDWAPERPYSGKGLRGARGTQMFGEREEGPRGGKMRDHTVLVTLSLSKVCLLYEVFGPGAPVASRRLFTVGDMEVSDSLALSDINKVLYQYSSETKPRQTQSPMLGLRCLETAPGEARLKISVLPLRLNVDQDTLHFLQDFAAAAIAATTPASPKSGTGEEEAPKLELHIRAESEARAPPELGDLGPISQPAPTTISSMDESVATLAGLFASSSLMEESAVSEGDLLPTEDPTPSVQVSLNSHHRQTTPVIRFSKSGDSGSEATEDGRRSQELEEHIQNFLHDNQASSSQAPGSGLYFTEVKFSPSLTLRLDYEGKQRFDPVSDGSRGKLEGLLLGLSQLRCTQLTLKELHCKQGLKGLKVVQYFRDEWVNDILRNQLPGVVGSVGPLSSFTQILGGLRDLFVLPVEEWRTGEGHVVKGFQQGAASFGVSTATAAIDLTSGLLGVLQGVAGLLFEIVTPEYPPGRRMIAMDATRQPRQPLDFREGVGMAYDLIRQGTAETVEVVQLARVEEMSRGQPGVLGVLRQATPTLLRPVLLLSRASAHVLGGLKNQLHPDARREHADKWKHA